MGCGCLDLEWKGSPTWEILTRMSILPTQQTTPCIWIGKTGINIPAAKLSVNTLRATVLSTVPLVTTAHTSTSPTPSLTVYTVCSSPIETPVYDNGSI